MAFLLEILNICMRLCREAFGYPDAVLDRLAWQLWMVAVAYNVVLQKGRAGHLVSGNAARGLVPHIVPFAPYCGTATLWLTFHLQSTQAQKLK